MSSFVGYPSDRELLGRALRIYFPNASFALAPPTVDELGHAFEQACAQHRWATANILLKAVPLPPTVASLLKR